MKRLAIIILIPFFICCEQPNKITIDEYHGYFKELSKLIVVNEGKRQVFKFSVQDKELIKTKNGLKIEFDGSKIINEDGSLLPDDSIVVVVTECINQTDFIKSNVRTVSNNKLLISGGAYNIQMYCHEKSLQLRNYDSLTVFMPIYTHNEMSLFYGQTDSLNQVNWKNANKSLTVAEKPALLIVQGDSIDSADKFEYYNPIKISSLGWINCDRFSEQKNLVNLDYTFSTTEDTLVSRVLLIFKDINSLTSQFYIKSRKSIQYEPFQNIPLGSKVRFVAVSVINNRIFCFFEDLIIQEKQKIQIDLKETTDVELNKLINEL
jgi:hypothetical protein